MVPTRTLIPVSVSLDYLIIVSHVSFALGDTEDTTESSDEEDDMIARAMAFAKYRAANAGMTAAMINFNAVTQDADDDSSDELSDAATKVIAVIRNCTYAVDPVLRRRSSVALRSASRFHAAHPPFAHRGASMRHRVVRCST